jgi:hypothetical protein
MIPITIAANERIEAGTRARPSLALILCAGTDGPLRGVRFGLSSATQISLLGVVTTR